MNRCENHKWTKLVVKEDGKNFIVKKCVKCGLFDEEYEVKYNNPSIKKKKKLTRGGYG